MDKALLDALADVVTKIADSIMTDVLKRIEATEKTVKPAGTGAEDFSLVSEEIVQDAPSVQNVYAVQASCARAFGVTPQLLSQLHKSGKVQCKKRGVFVFLHVNELEQTLKYLGALRNKPDYSKLQTLTDYDKGKIKFTRGKVAPSGYYTSRDIAILFNIDTDPVSDAIRAGLIRGTKEFENSQYLVKDTDLKEALRRTPDLFKYARPRKSQ